ncbi:MAG TPA: dicarboxylate/amino acid:cation symporter [Gemmatimonadaceae bacterium]|nr:dicarboxylate/amino acid:cation symporter [Gemmatimonadaceae bacterium]
MSVTTRVLVALVAGLALGVAISLSGNTTLGALSGYLEPVGAMWVNAIRMTVIPLVVSAILIGITSLPNPKNVGRLGGRTLLFFLVVLLLAASFATVVGQFALSSMKIDSVAALAWRGGTVSGADALRSAQKITTLGQWLVDLIPANPIKAAADGSMLQLIVVTLLFGTAIATIAESSREHLMRVVRAVYEAALTLVRWVLLAAPVGVFALTVPLAAKLGIAAVGAVAVYVGSVSAMTLAFTSIFYLAVWLFGKRSLRVFARACAPAQAVALSSRSSLASLPALLDASDTVLRLPSSVRSFVLPLAVATFRPAGAIAIPMGVLFMARIYGVSLDAHQLMTITLMAVITTFSAPGIPGGSIIVMVPVLLAAGLPVDAVGLLIGVDTIPDMVRTVTNVTGDMAAATILARGSVDDNDGAANSEL